MLILASAVVFAVAYLLNILTITVGYHRSLAHKSVVLHPALRALVIRGGPWLTGLDPKAWVVMHRLHHEHSDTPRDPHSPVNVGLAGIAMEQLRSYMRVNRGLLKNDSRYTTYAKDLEFPLGTLIRSGRWYLPYLVHASVAIGLALTCGGVLGVAYFVGIMSHPFQGGIVNALGHAMGGRNFDVRDNSRNNHLAAWLVFGEGFQNNHHRYPSSASFSYRRHEIDLGYLACVILEKLGLATIDRAHLIPGAAWTRERHEAAREAT